MLAIYLRSLPLLSTFGNLETNNEDDLLSDTEVYWIIRSDLSRNDVPPGEQEVVPGTQRQHRSYHDKEKTRFVRVNDMRLIRRDRNCPFLHNAQRRDIPERERVPIYKDCLADFLVVIWY